MTQGGAPPLIKDLPVFSPEREELRGIAPELRRQLDAGEEIDPALLTKAQTLTRALLAKSGSLKQNSPERNAAERYFKALLGLFKMLETPAINVLLSGVEKRPDASLGELLSFMGAFNLRFGAAQTPAQTEAYQRLYPMLVALRDQTIPATATPPAPPAPGTVENPSAEVFSGVPIEHIDPARRNSAPTPP